MRPFSKHWLNLSWPGSLNPYQGQCINLGQEIRLRQIILRRHQETQLKLCFHKLHQDPSRPGVCYQATHNLRYLTTLNDEQTCLPQKYFM